MNAQGGENDIETYSSASFSTATNTSDDGYGATDSTSLTGFRGAAYDGTNYYTFFDGGGSFIITHSSLTNFENDTRVSTEEFDQVADGQNWLTSNVRGFATADGNTFYALFNSGSSDLLLEYSSIENIKKNSQVNVGGLSMDWDVIDAVGLGYDGTNFYVAFDTDGTDEIRTYTSEANLRSGTHTATRLDGAGAPDLDNAQLGWGLAVTPVPEPTTYAAIATLLMAFGIVRRRLKVRNA